jgi:soluble lytic murein transglycosylase-like protein
MLSENSVPPSDQTATSPKGGCLIGLLIPPLAVILVSTLLAMTWLSIGSSNPSMIRVAAAGRSEANATQGNISSSLFPQGSNQAAGQALSPVFRPEVQYWSEAIKTWAAEVGLDPNLVATVMQIESCGDPRALSRAGAMGLFQVMPYHFAEGEDPYDPSTNAKRGLAYLKRSQEAAGGDTRNTLAGYNGGIGVMERAEAAWSSETQRYVFWGSGIFADASSGSTEGLHLQEWLATSGEYLCRQAHSRLGITP